MLVDPVAPNISATPYRKNAVANEPSRKYFSDDFAARRLIAPESGQNVSGDRRNFQRDENQNQFHRRGHQRHAHRAEKNQRVIFAGANPLHRHVFERTQDHDGRNGDHQDVEEHAEAVHLHHVPERQSRRLRHVPRGAKPGQRAAQARYNPATFWLFSSSTSGSSSITTMPNTDRMSLRQNADVVHALRNRLRQR